MRRRGLTPGAILAAAMIGGWIADGSDGLAYGFGAGLVGCFILAVAAIVRWIL